MISKFKSLEDAKQYLTYYLTDSDNNLTFIDLLSSEHKEFRLSFLYAIRPLITEDTMKKYDYNEKALFMAIFQNDFEYHIPTPTIPDVELTDYELNWFQRLTTGGIQAAHVLINNNSQVNLISIKNIYYYAVNHGYSYDNPKLLQIMMIIASPFLSGRVKKEECFNPTRIFFKTFLPEYYQERYEPLDCLDILYCINAKSIKEVFRKSEIKEKECKWESSKNGILIDEMLFQALDEYMNLKQLSPEEKLENLIHNDSYVITTASPLLSIYYGHKQMVKILKHYNLKSTTILVNNDGRWIYHHVLDMYMAHLDKTEATRLFSTYYILREEHHLPKVECLDVYKIFKDKQQSLSDVSFAK